MSRRRDALTKLRAEGGQVKADFEGRVGGARDLEAETGRTALYEELRKLPRYRLAYRAGLSQWGPESRQELIAMIINFEKGVAPAGDMCMVRGVKSEYCNRPGGTMDATATPQPYRPPVETKRFKDSHGTPRNRVRYEGQRRWYRGLANAQIAHSFKRDTYPEPSRAATHEGRDQLITEALGVAPGETLTIEVDMDRLAGALEKTGHPAAADVRKRANGAEGGTTMTEVTTPTAESLMEGVGEALDGVGEAVPNAKGTYYRLRMAGGKTLAYADVRKDGFRLDLAADAVEKAPARFQGALVRKGNRARLNVTAKNAKLARDLLVWVAPKIDKQS